MIDVTKLSEEERAVVLARRAYYREWKKRTPIRSRTQRHASSKSTLKS